jgi:hypothetical protein
MLALLTTQRATGGHSFGFEHRAAGATGPASLHRSAAHLPAGADAPVSTGIPSCSVGVRPSREVVVAARFMRLRRHSHNFDERKSCHYRYDC